MRECDLIMKGGITSGVVYPKAITTIAAKYRLRNIGGTSAGAIAAVVAGAAEYRRQTQNDTTGFDLVDVVAKDLGADMRGLFQPAPKMARLFNLLFGMLERKKGQSKVTAALRAVLENYGQNAIGGLFLAGIFALFAYFGLAIGFVLLGMLVSALVSLVMIVVAIARDLRQGGPAHDFGLCPGKTQDGFDQPALTDWLANKIDEVAGHDTTGPPLTHGDLRSAGVSVATMTTDLASKRPYQLPLLEKTNYFSKAEFDQLFPKRVVDYLIAGKSPHKVVQRDVPTDLYQLPYGDDFPVILIARFSLSFPGLISAVPLWRYDYQLPKENGRNQMARCLLSDGGISSNFPVHLFDAPLPSRPTFGIALSAWEEKRHGDKRVSLPTKGRPSTDLPIRPPLGLLGFVMSILNTSKDWQDTLQSMLPGTADRIVEIRLDEKNEGGMNLTMDPEVIEQLVDYGQQAGEMLLSEFDFDEHRWQRALAVLPGIDSMLAQLNTAYHFEPDGDGTGKTLSYSQVLRDYPVSYLGDNSLKWRKTVLDRYALALADQGTGDGIGARLKDGDLPQVDAFVRLVADANRSPRRG